MFHIGKFRLCFLKLCWHCFQCIVDSCDISERISADFHRMAHGTFDIHHEFIVERIKGHIQLKSKIFPHIGTGIDAPDFLTHGNDGSSGFFFIRIDLIPDPHREKLLICWEIGFCSLNICLQATDTLLQNGYLLWIMLCNVVLQTVFLTGVVGFHQFQLADLNIQIHLFFYIGIPRCQSLNLCIRKCCFVHILTTSHRRFACHNLTDKFLLILDKLP